MVRLISVPLLTVLATGALTAQIVVQPAVTEPPEDPSRDDSRPAVFVIGDSTVKNHGPGEGWGDYLAPFVDARRIQVVNWAMGGRSSRSFIEEGRWARALAQMKRGDFVLVQFGHNDRRELTTDRGTIPSIGGESQDVINEATKRKTTVRTFGWYLRQYARDSRARGVTLIFLSPVPRNDWSADGRLNNVMAGHARLMAQVAAEEKVPFFDLNEAVARLYSGVGQQMITARFFTVGDSAHTNVAGAEANAATVVDGLRSLPQTGLAAYLQPTALQPLNGSRKPSWARGIEGQRKADLGNGYFLNPIMSGDHPDPSILKDGSDYYMTFSSFDAYPGLVIWHSNDLVNWQPIVRPSSRTSDRCGRPIW